MEPVNKKMKFSPGSLEQFENEAMNLHNIAMGYVTRPIQDVNNQDLIQLAMKEFPVPEELHDSFQSWIRKNQLAKFDCFLDPSVECDCYKCKIRSRTKKSRQWMWFSLFSNSLNSHPWFTKPSYLRTQYPWMCRSLTFLILMLMYLLLSD